MFFKICLDILDRSFYIRLYTDIQRIQEYWSKRIFPHHNCADYSHIHRSLYNPVHGSSSNVLDLGVRSCFKTGLFDKLEPILIIIGANITDNTAARNRSNGVEAFFSCITSMTPRSALSHDSQLSIISFENKNIYRYFNPFLIDILTCRIGRSINSCLKAGRTITNETAIIIITDRILGTIIPPCFTLIYIITYQSFSGSPSPPFQAYRLYGIVFTVYTIKSYQMDDGTVPSVPSQLLAS